MSKVIENTTNTVKARFDTSNQIMVDKRNAVRWFTKAIQGISNNSKKMPQGLYSISGHDYPFYGELALFGYDAKTKDELPYWDSFPLIIVCNIRGNGFSGFNVHYMPLKARKEIMKVLIHHKNKSRSQTLYARKVVPILKTLSETEISFCYKNYLASHVKTKFVIVGREYWQLASELPLQQFNKASASEVWSDHRRYTKHNRIRRRK